MSSVPPVADSRPSISVSSVDRSLVLASCPPEAAPLCSVRPPACHPSCPSHPQSIRVSMVQKWGDTMAPRTRKVSYKPQDRPKKTRHEPACEHIHKHQFTDRMQRQRRTHDGVDLVDEDDGGRGEAGALESVAQQGLALAHVHAEQLRARQRLQPHPAAACGRLRHSGLAAPCTTTGVGRSSSLSWTISSTVPQAPS